MVNLTRIYTKTGDGETIIEDAFHIDRGYPDFAAQLLSLGADVSRI